MKSDSALGTLTVPESILKADPLLALITGLSSALQLTVNVTKCGAQYAHASPSANNAVGDGNHAFRLELANESTLSQRNTILRTLCTFPSPLDSSPFNLMGGYTTGNAQSATAKIGLAKMNSWMSYASSLKAHYSAGDDTCKVSGSLDQILRDLNDFLGTRRSFLLDTGFISLADLSVYFAILELCGADDGVTNFANSSMIYHHTSRWIDTVQYWAGIYLGEVKKRNHLWVKQIGFQSFAISPPSNRMIPPVFLYGSERSQSQGEDHKQRESRISTSVEKFSSETGKKLTKEIGKAPSFGAPAHGEEGMTDAQKKAVAEKRALKAVEKNSKKGGNAVSDAGAKRKEGSEENIPSDVDISALEIRVGYIVKVWKHEAAEKLYCEEIDVGPEAGGIRKIASGLRPFYSLESLQDLRVLVLCNLKARNLVGFPSHGMVLCASNIDHTKVEAVVPPPDAKVGERIIFEGYGGKDPEPENRVAKKKMFEKLAPDLRTDSQGGVLWKGAKAMTTAGQCYAMGGMPNAQVA